MKRWVLFLGMAAVLCAAAAFLPFRAGDAAENDAYTIDFSQSSVQQSLVPYYVSTATDGYAEELSEHWQIDPQERSIRRINDFDTSDGADILGKNANLFFKDAYYRFFEMTVSVRLEKIAGYEGLYDGLHGVAGVLFGSNNMAHRFMQSGNGIFLMPDYKIEAYGSTISNARTGSAASQYADADGFIPLKIRVTADGPDSSAQGHISVWAESTLILNAFFPAELIEAGRIGLFTANCDASFRDVSLRNLNAEGEYCPPEEYILATGVRFGQETVEVMMGQEGVRLDASVLPENASDQKLTWVCSSPDVVAVDSEGVLYPLQVGQTKVYAVSEDGGFQAECLVTVVTNVPALEGVALSETELHGVVGEEALLEAFVLPEGAPEDGFRWSCSDTTVAFVNNGRVMFMAPGECTITVKDYNGEFSATCRVVVTDGATESAGCASSAVAGSALFLPLVAAALFLALKRKGRG